MPNKKQFSSTMADFEKKLDRVMKRLGVEKYQYDYSSTRTNSSCYVEMRYGASTYRFENSVTKSAECGRNLTYLSDLFGDVVYSLEGLARSVERGILTLDMLLVGVPALPEAKPLEPCFAALGFTQRPESIEEVKTQYHRRVKELHPDTGIGGADLDDLKKNYQAAKDLMGG